MELSIKNNNNTVLSPKKKTFSVFLNFLKKKEKKDSRAYCGLSDLYRI